MKTEMVFNHDEETMIAALGVAEGFDERIGPVIEKMVEANISKKSQVAELMHNELEYRVILLLATEELNRSMRRGMAASLGSYLLADSSEGGE